MARHEQFGDGKPRDRTRAVPFRQQPFAVDALSLTRRNHLLALGRAISGQFLALNQHAIRERGLIAAVRKVQEHPRQIDVENQVIRGGRAHAHLLTARMGQPQDIAVPFDAQRARVTEIRQHERLAISLDVRPQVVLRYRFDLDVVDFHAFTSPLPIATYACLG